MSGRDVGPTRRTAPRRSGAWRITLCSSRISTRCRIAGQLKPWKKHWRGAESLNDIASESPEAPQPFSPYSPAEVLEYWQLCDDRIDAAVDALNLEAPQCGFPWYKMGTLEHQFVNIRHIQHHAAILSARLRKAAGITVDWVANG